MDHTYDKNEFTNLYKTFLETTEDSDIKERSFKEWELHTNYEYGAEIVQQYKNVLA